MEDDTDPVEKAGWVFRILMVLPACASHGSNARPGACVRRRPANPFRVLADACRVLAKACRVLEEASQVLAGTCRVTADMTGGLAEASRVLAEASRVLAEACRVLAEASRVLAEACRVPAEPYRGLPRAFPWSVECARTAFGQGQATGEKVRLRLP